MKKNSNSKIIWITIFVFLAIVLCYMFVVLYFFYISPYNISLKISLWPFMSTNSIGELYQDATVEINYSYFDEDFESVEVSVVGVNVQQDGYIIAPYDQMKYAQDSEITINTNSGTVYDGEILFSSDVFNLCIIKCSTVVEGGTVKIPYVNFSASSISDVVAVTYDNSTVWSAEVSAIVDYVNEIEVSGRYAIDLIVEDCYGMVITDESFNGDVVFDKKGNFLGFAYRVNTTSAYNYNVIPVDFLQLVFDDVVACYEAGESYVFAFADSFVGLDWTELYYHYSVANDEFNEGSGDNVVFYFPDSARAENGWIEWDEDIIMFYNSQIDGFFLLDDFEYDGKTISKNSLIISLEVNGYAYRITSTADFYWLLYQLDSGDVVTFNVYELLGYTSPENILTYLTHNVIITV